MNNHTQTAAILAHSFLITCLIIIVVNLSKRLDAAIDVIASHKLTIILPATSGLEWFMIACATAQLVMVIGFIYRTRGADK